VREVFLAKGVAPPLYQFLSFFTVVPDADCSREKLVGAHADQGPHNVERHVVASFRERVHPGLCVRVVAVYERAVDVEDYALKQQPYFRFF
jgi:hypothetical protein